MNISPINLASYKSFISINDSSNPILSALDNSLLSSSFTSFITPKLNAKFNPGDPIHSAVKSGNDNHRFDINFISDLNGSDALAPVPIESISESTSASNLLSMIEPGPANTSADLLGFFFSSAQAAEGTIDDNHSTDPESGSVHPLMPFLTPIMNGFISPPVQAAKVATPFINMFDPDKSDVQPRLPPGVKIIKQPSFFDLGSGYITIGDQEDTLNARRYHEKIPVDIIEQFEGWIAEHYQHESLPPFQIEVTKDLFNNNFRFVEVLLNHNTVRGGILSHNDSFKMQMDKELATGFNPDGEHSRLGFIDPTDKVNPTWYPLTIDQFTNTIWSVVQEGLEAKYPQGINPVVLEQWRANRMTFNMDIPNPYDSTSNPRNGLVPRP